MKVVAVAQYVNDLTEDLGGHMDSMKASLHVFIEVRGLAGMVLGKVSASDEHARWACPPFASLRNTLQLAFKICRLSYVVFEALAFSFQSLTGLLDRFQRQPFSVV